MSPTRPVPLEGFLAGESHPPGAQVAWQLPQNRADPVKLLSAVRARRIEAQIDE